MRGQDEGDERARGARMGRDARRAQLLQVAQDLFTAEGYHHVTMDDIGARADVSKPVLYRHFPSKLDLYLAVVDERGAVLLEQAEAALAPLRGLGEDAAPVSGREVVAAIVRAYLRFVDVAGDSSSLLFESDVTHDPAVRARVEHASSQVRGQIAEVLLRVTALAPPEAALVAAELVALAQRAATYRLRVADAPDGQTAVKVTTRLVWGGVAGLLASASA